MSPVRAVSLLLVGWLVLSLSACLDKAPTTPEVAPPLEAGNAHDVIFDRVKAVLGDLPCTVPTVGAGTSDNFLLLNHTKWEARGSQEIDIRGNLLYSARAGGISIVDITDPLAPRILGNYTEAGGQYDVKVSPDNMTALVGIGKGIHMVDVRDPANMVKAGEWLFPATIPVANAHMPLENAHMLFTALIKEEQWVFLAPNTNTGVWILKLQGPPEARTLEFVTQTLPVQGGALGPHDMIVQWDEMLKAHVLYSADGFEGWTAWDVSDPANPMIIGGIPRPESGYLHTIQAAKIGDRRIVATIAEVGANFMQIYDATNLRTPILLGAWQVGNPASAQHNFNIVEGKMYLAHYGSGIFVFDLTELPALPSDRLANTKPIAHYAGIDGVASFWDVLLKDGVVWGSDIGNGVQAIGFGCVKPGDPIYTSIN